MIDTRIVNVNQLQARIGASSGGGATVDAEYVERFNKAVGDPERVKSMWANPALRTLDANLPTLITSSVRRIHLDRVHMITPSQS